MPWSCVVDEKFQIQPLDRMALLLPLRPGQAERRTHDSKRHGTTSLFTELDAHTGGMVFAETRRRHGSIEFRKFLDRIDAAVPPNLEVHLIMDNYGTHKTPLIRKWLAKRPHAIVHSTPTYSSWLKLGHADRSGVHNGTDALRFFVHDALGRSHTWPTRDSERSH